MKIKVVRETEAADYTLGTMFVDGAFFAYTCERPDRRLEDGGEKIDGQTAIPRGSYSVTVNFSPHFQRELTEVVGVPDFTGVRVHGGNHATDSEGCVLIGRVRTADGVQNCGERVQALTDTVQAALDRGEAVTMEVV